MQIKLERIYAWDSTREDPDNPQALLVVSKDPFELADVDTDRPRLRKAPDWGSARYGMLGVELYGEILDAYEDAVLNAEDWWIYRDVASAFGVDALGALEDLPQYGEPGERWVTWPPDPRGLRLVTFRSVEIVQAYAGWLWKRQAGT